MTELAGTHLELEHDGCEHLEAGLYAQQLEGQVEGEVHQREPRVVRQGKQQRGLQLPRQNLDLQTYQDCTLYIDFYKWQYIYMLFHEKIDHLNKKPTIYYIIISPTL